MLAGVRSEYCVVVVAAAAVAACDTFEFDVAALFAAGAAAECRAVAAVVAERVAALELPLVEFDS